MVRTTLVILLFAVLPAAGLHAEEFKHNSPDFEVTLPAGFTRELPDDPSVIGLFTQPGITHSTEIRFVRYGREITREAVDPEKMMVFPGLGENIVERYNTSWGSQTVNCAVVQWQIYEGDNSMTVHAHIAWVPLKGEAIIVAVVGNSLESAQLRHTLREVLEELDGPSSLGMSMPPLVLLFVAIPMLLALGVGGFFLLRRRRQPPRAPVWTQAPPSNDQPPMPAALPTAPPPQTRVQPRKDAPPWEQ